MKGVIKYFIAALVAIALAVVFYFNTLKLQPAGYMLPRILIVVIILLSVAMMIEAYRADKKKSQVDVDKSNEASEIDYKRVAVFVLLIAGYIFTIKPLGYFIVTPFYVILSYLYLKATKLRNIILIAFGFTAFVYLLFVIFLKLPIPLGPMS